MYIVYLKFIFFKHTFHLNICVENDADMLTKHICQWPIIKQNIKYLTVTELLAIEYLTVTRIFIRIQAVCYSRTID